MHSHAISCTRAAGSLELGGIRTGSMSRLFPVTSQLSRTAIRQQARCLSQLPISNIRPIPARTTIPPARVPCRALATSSASSPVPVDSAEAIPTTLSWNDYLSLRQKRRYYNLGSSMVTGFASFTGGASFLMTQDLEKLSSVLFGLDPMMAMGFASFGFGTLGWLVGPFLGEALFRMSHRRVMAQMETKERNFYQRIKKNRADPSAQSVSNPVPDYYGEKIASVQGYRQWLKDQRAFRKKRETPMD